MRNLPAVAVVLPAYNEEALDTFLAEIEAALVPVTSTLVFVVVDDCSSRALPVAEIGARLPLGSPVQLHRNQSNLGHGPSALRAWSEGLAQDPDVVLHVDGDGQFLGEDFPRVLEAVGDRDGALGARIGRREPWFRHLLSLGARVLTGHGLSGADVNTPLRAYRAPVVRRLLASVPDQAVVPHLHFAILHAQLGLDVADIGVAHRPRRGDSEVGTTWQGGRLAALLPSRRLLSLALRAVRELRESRTSATLGQPALKLLEDAA